jgi:hypothetical protein
VVDAADEKEMESAGKGESTTNESANPNEEPEADEDEDIKPQKKIHSKSKKDDSELMISEQWRQGTDMADLDNIAL